MKNIPNMIYYNNIMIVNKTIQAMVKQLIQIQINWSKVALCLFRHSGTSSRIYHNNEHSNKSV